MNNQHSNVWSNVYWNNSTTENGENHQHMNNMNNPPQSQYSGFQVKSGAFGSSWNSSGPSSLPVCNTEKQPQTGFYDNSGPRSLWGQHNDLGQKSQTSSGASSQSSSMSSQAWGDMLDSVIMDEVQRMKQSNSGSFSSLSSMQYWSSTKSSNHNNQKCALIVSILLYFTVKYILTTILLPPTSFFLHQRLQLQAKPPPSVFVLLPREKFSCERILGPDSCTVPTQTSHNMISFRHTKQVIFYEFTSVAGKK